MRRKRRPLRVILLVAVLSGAAFYALEASLRTEREYAAFVHQLASGQESRVLESEFQRGWLRSSAQTSLEVAGGAGLAFRSAVEALGAQDVRSRVGISMSNEIEHGLLPLFDWARNGFEGPPVLARIRSTIEIDQESQLALSESVGKLPPLEAQTLLRTGGLADTRFSIRGEHLKARGEGVEREGRWLGLDGSLSFSLGFRRVDGRISSPGLESLGHERRVGVRDLVWEFSLPAGEFPVGRMKLSVAGLQIDSAIAQGPSFGVEGLRIQGDSHVAGGSFGAGLEASAARVVLDAEPWGPGSLRLALNDVDADTLRRIRRLGVRLRFRDDTATPAGPATEPLPLGGPQLVVEALDLSTPHGPVTGTGRFVLASQAPSAAAPDSATTGSLLSGEIDVRLPAAVLDSVADARARGALAPEGATLDSDAFSGRVREHRDAWLAALRSSGRLVADGSLLAVHTTWVPADPTEDPEPVAGAPEAEPTTEAAAHPAAPEATPSPPSPEAAPVAPAPPAAPALPAAPAPPAAPAAPAAPASPAG